MNADKWQKINELFNSALEVEAVDRIAFIKAETDDDEIFAEVQKLIFAHEEANSFIQKPIAEDALKVLSNENNETMMAESRTFSDNQKIGHYEIIQPIGAGGMGEVFLAQDTKLDRKVAIKFLNEKFAKHESNLNRFIKEAKSATALNHPNILTIHEIGESENTHFIVSEYIEGKTLREILRDKTLTLKEILNISIQIANALSTAHQARIIHRDIKPENIIVRPDGYVKILDFGLAKLVGDKNKSLIGLDDATIKQNETAKGIILGTVNYMSPEQAKGEKVDERTDLFSLGAVIYEMIAGKTPFAGDSVSETFANLIKTEPLPLSDFVQNIPDELQMIVSKLLQKKTEDRYQTAKSLMQDLEAVKDNLHIQDRLEKSVLPDSDENRTQILKQTTADEIQQTIVNPTTETKPKSYKHFFLFGFIGLLILTFGYFGYKYFKPSKQIESIAVLPFVNKSDNPDLEYLSDGLAESLIYRLSQIPNLKVSPTSSVFHFKDQKLDAKQAAAELKVDAVITGRISQRGDNLSISIEFVDVRNDRSLGGEQYDRKMSELLNTQREIANEITNKLQLKLSGEGEQKLAKKYTNSNEAFQQYLKGRYHFARRNKDDMFKAIEYYNQAIKIDPNFALTYAYLAEAYNHLPNFAYISPNESIPQAKAAAKKALELDPNLSEAYTGLANSLAAYDWNWAEAESNFKKAIELDPNNALARFRYATEYLSVVGRSDEALAEVNHALELAPLDLNILTAVARIYSMSGQPEKALEQSRKVRDIDPDFIIGRWLLGRSYNLNGLYDEAIALGKDTLEKHPNHQVVMCFLGVAYAKSGHRREAEEVVKKYQEIEKTGYASSYLLSSIYFALDEREKGFAELNKAFEKKDTWLKWLKVDPYLANIRTDSRYKEMIKRLNYPD